MIMAAFAFIAVLPLQVSAARNGAVHLETEENHAVNVSVTVPKAAGEKVSSLQLGLQITDQEGRRVGQDTLDQIENLTFVWSQEVQERAKITEQRYQGEEGILRLYIAGTAPLFAEDAEEPDTLTLGTVSAVVKDGEEAGMSLYVNMLEDSLKIVRGTEAVPIPTAASEAVPIIAGQKPDEPTKPGGDDENPGDGDQNPGNGDENPGDGDQNPGNGNQKPGSSEGGAGSTGGSSDQQGADKSQLQEIINLAENYQEKDYTWESYRLLLEALRNAQAVLNDPSATREEIEQAIQAVQNAIGGLVPAEVTSVDTRYDRNSLYGSQNQAAAGTGDAISWEVYAAWIILSTAVMAGAGMWKKNRKRIR